MPAAQTEFAVPVIAAPMFGPTSERQHEKNTKRGLDIPRVCATARTLCETRAELAKIQRRLALTRQSTEAFGGMEVPYLSIKGGCNGKRGKQ